MKVQISQEKQQKTASKNQKAEKKQQSNELLTHDNAVVISIPNNFVFQFFPALEGLVDKELARVSKSHSCQGNQLFLGFCKSRPKTAECESSTNKNGITNALCSRHCLKLQNYDLLLT